MNLPGGPVSESFQSGAFSEFTYLKVLAARASPLASDVQDQVEVEVQDQVCRHLRLPMQIHSLRLDLDLSLDLDLDLDLISA
jgi:hypothetical protein